MNQLSQYSSAASGLPTTSEIAGDWFMGSGGSGYYVFNSMDYVGFGQSLDNWTGGAIMLAGTLEVVNTLVTTGNASPLGIIGAVGGAAVWVYQGAKYRDAYEMRPCPVMGVAYCH